MNRRSFLTRTGLAAASLSLTPADLLFPGTNALTTLSEADALAALDALRDEAPCRAEVRTERGGPRLFINGEEVPPLFGLSTALLPTLDNFERVDVSLLQPIIGLQSFWTGPGTYDWSAHDAYLGRLLDRAPDAFFFPRLQLQVPVWWKETYPEALIQYGLDVPPGSIDRITTRNLERMEGGHYFTEFYGEAWEASWAAPRWRTDVKALLRAYIAHIEQSPLVSRYLGYFVVNGKTSEWNTFGDDYLPDYNPAMQAAAGPVPSPEDRIFCHYGLLRDPEEEQPVMGYYRRYHELVAETVAELAETVKDAVDDRVLFGTFFAYVTEKPRIQEAGYLFPRAVLDSPHIDLIACPYTYQNTNDPKRERWMSELYDGAGHLLGRARGVGGDGAYRVMRESIKRRGKLFVSEIDPATYLDAGNAWRGIGGSGSDTKEGTLKIIRRDWGKVFADGVGGWLFDFGPAYDVTEGWYSSDLIIDEMRQLTNLFATHLDRDLSPTAEILFVGDTDSAIATRHWQAERPWPGQGIRYTDLFNHWFLNSQNRAVQRLGAPVDYLHRFDVTAGDLRRYRLVLVPYAFLMRPDEVDDLRAMLRGSGATVVWYYAPGFVRPDRLDLDQMQRLTGFHFAVNDVPGPLLIDAVLPGDPPLEQRFGLKSPEHYSPRFVVQDTGDVEVLGHWQDSSSDIAFARTAMDGWTSVYVGTAPLTVELLRRLTTDAGAALWSSRPDVITATQGAAVVVATEAGSRTVRFPRPMHLVDGDAPPASTATLDLAFGAVRLFVSA